MKKKKKFFILLFIVACFLTESAKIYEKMPLNLSLESKQYLYFLYISPSKTVYRGKESILIFDTDVIYRYEKCNYNYLLVDYYTYTNWSNRVMYLQNGRDKTVVLNIKNDNLSINYEYQESDEYLYFDTVFYLEGKNVIGYNHYFVDSFPFNTENNVITKFGCGGDYVKTEEFEQIYTLPSRN